MVAPRRVGGARRLPSSVVTRSVVDPETVTTDAAVAAEAEAVATDPAETTTKAAGTTAAAAAAAGADAEDLDEDTKALLEDDEDDVYDLDGACERVVCKANRSPFLVSWQRLTQKLLCSARSRCRGGVGEC